MKIISYEGLMGRVGRWVRGGLLSQLQMWKGVKFEEHVWTDAAADCDDEPCIIIGHSFGARGAIDSAKKSEGVKLLVLLDPRVPPPADMSKVKAPKGVPTVCFYQRGFMPGYPVEGAENIRLNWTMHTNVPKHPAVMKYLKEYFAR